MEVGKVADQGEVLPIKINCGIQIGFGKFSLACLKIADCKLIVDIAVALAFRQSCKESLFCLLEAGEPAKGPALEEMCVPHLTVVLKIGGEEVKCFVFLVHLDGIVCLHQSLVVVELGIDIVQNLLDMVLCLPCRSLFKITVQILFCDFHIALVEMEESNFAKQLLIITNHFKALLECLERFLLEVVVPFTLAVVLSSHSAVQRGKIDVGGSLGSKPGDDEEELLGKFIVLFLFLRNGSHIEFLRSIRLNCKHK
ncbi:hypothetical protein SDC9_92481 [bioreactor metagenome]|uniref:Uncharacterized protein n=1 Tax=bioreactor metagenome TaxID=1076179 RepID=A0A644ZXV1_9ZZZZ